MMVPTSSLPNSGDGDISALSHAMKTNRGPDDQCHLGRRTSSELALAPAQILLIPLGATEQHGPHLSVDTDSCIALAWAEAIAAEMPSTIVAPVLPYGSSGEHQTLPGTLSIGADVTRLVVIELIRSATADGFGAVVIVCGHAGNAGPVSEAVAQMGDEGHQTLALFPTWDPSRFPQLDAHAGWAETSIMLWLDPTRVDSTAIEPGQRAPLSELMPRLIADGVGSVAPNGVLGDPTTADSEAGRLLFADLTTRAVASVARLFEG